MESLNSDLKSWGMKEDIELYEDFKSIFRSVLKRCGRYLIDLSFDENGRSEVHTLDNEIVDMIVEECPKLKNIDVGYQEFSSKSEIEIIKRIFTKFKKLNCSLDVTIFFIEEEFLKALFLSNKILENVTVHLSKYVGNG